MRVKHGEYSFRDIVCNKVPQKLLLSVDRRGVLLNKEKRLIEKIEQTISKTDNCCPVFIVGLPRSGTTLLYQLLLNHFYFSYFTVFVSLLPSTPLFALKLQSGVFKEMKDLGYNSTYGRVRNNRWGTDFIGPSEGHVIFEKWFSGKSHHEFREPLSEKIKRLMHATITGFEVLSSKPFINKNTRNSLRVIPISDLYPKALFIVLQREPVYIAQSLFIARKTSSIKNKKRKSNWWGTRPSNFEEFLDLDSLEQSVFQTLSIEKELNRQLSQIKNKISKVSYDDLCQSPTRTLQQIESFLNDNSISISGKPNCGAIENFENMNKVKISDFEFHAMSNLINNSSL